MNYQPLKYSVSDLKMFLYGVERELAMPWLLVVNVAGAMTVPVDLLEKENFNLLDGIWFKGFNTEDEATLVKLSLDVPILMFEHFNTEDLS